MRQPDKFSEFLTKVQWYAFQICAKHSQNMTLPATITGIKDWADLLHAVAWPIVALIALFLFRRSIDRAVHEVLSRIPWERTTSVKARGLGEVQLTKKSEQKIVETVKIPPQLEPPKKAEKDA